MSNRRASWSYESRKRRSNDKLRMDGSYHPLVRRLLEEIKASKLTCQDVLAAAGIDRGATHKWKRSQTPTLRNIEAAFNALGFDVTVTRR